MTFHRQVGINPIKIRNDKTLSLGITLHVCGHIPLNEYFGRKGNLHGTEGKIMEGSEVMEKKQVCLDLRILLGTVNQTETSI